MPNTNIFHQVGKAQLMLYFLRKPHQAQLPQNKEQRTKQGHKNKTAIKITGAQGNSS